MSKSSYILLADYAKSAGLSLEEARELVSREENKKFFKVANGKEMVSTAIGKKNPPATAEQEETPAPQEKPAPARYRTARSWRVHWPGWCGRSGRSEYPAGYRYPAAL